MWSCNDSSVGENNVTFDWSLDYGSIDLQDTLTCDEDDVAAAVNTTTEYLNGNLDDEGNCTQFNRSTTSITVGLCTSNAVWLGTYEVESCDGIVADNTTIFLAKKTLICNADLDVNSLPLYVGAAALATVVIIVTLFLYVCPPTKPVRWVSVSYTHLTLPTIYSV